MSEACLNNWNTASIYCLDPNQLPPTVLSNNAAKFDYQQSLFVRLQKGRSKSSTFLLAYQYRMHPDIAKFPNTIFYDSLLKVFVVQYCNTNFFEPGWRRNEREMFQALA